MSATCGPAAMCRPDHILNFLWRSQISKFRVGESETGLSSVQWLQTRSGAQPEFTFLQGTLGSSPGLSLRLKGLSTLLG
eukprot:752542-Hanusia_phi.AAC.7